MKQKLLVIALLLSWVTFSAKAQERNCHTMDVFEQQVQENPSLLDKMNSIESRTQSFIEKSDAYRSAVSGVVTIPVVVHVIYNNSNENISQAQIQSQIDVLNEDYRKLNSDANLVPSEFASVAADIEVEFVMATTDPSGNATSGITRKSSSRTEWGTNDDMKKTSQGGVAAWDASKYLNMWVCNIGGGILGYAQFPGGSLSTDGVVMSPQYFGSSDKGTGFFLSAPFDKGRTATHEVGHWLNLRHIWGDGNCSADDYVSDTPVSGNPNYGCPNYPTNSCSATGNDMTMNYMDYVDDNCMYMFTAGQKSRMLALFSTGGFREGFVTDGGGTDPEPTYCASKGNSVADEWIANVTVAGLNKSTSANGGYADFTSTSVDLAAGSSNSVSLSPGFSGTAYNEYWRIWIDFNNNGDFSDSGELVYDAGSLSNSTVTGTLNIPSGAATGATRMRVSMKYNGASTPCETFSYGEVEDYTVNITSATATCDTPSNLSTSSVTTTTFTLNWGAVTGAQSYNVQLRAAGTTTWSDFSPTSNSQSLSGATAGTTYEWRVRTVCSGSTSSYSAISSFTTAQASVNYCASKGNSVADEWIARVQLGSINNTSSANGGYADFTNLSTTVNRGSSYTITIDPKWAGTTYNEAYNVWIDWNQDGDFNDAGEAVYSRSATKLSSVSGTIAVPTSALSGATRMRVTMKYNANATSCETFSYGEVEDYTINVSASSKTAENIAVNDVVVFPNPAKSQTVVRFNTETAMDVKVSLYDAVGRQINSRTIQNIVGTHDETIEVSNLEAGIYHIFVEANGKKESYKLVKN